MLCSIYKSLVKPDTYLYIEKRDDFSKVPEKLLETFGRPQFVMLINLASKDKLAQAEKQKVLDELADKGFYLQLPPPTEDLLKAHLKVQKAKTGQADE
jgi:uncharacterized protein YcgL (UPF0745 family)